MKNIFICLLITCCCTCNGQKTDNTNRTARKIFKEHLSTVKKFFSEINTRKGYSDDENNHFETSTRFLVQLTKLDCFDYSFIGCEPKKEDYENWKIWYKLNKKKLFTENSKVKINTPHPLTRNPVKFYKRNLRLVKKSIKQNVFEEPEYFDSIYFLRRITDTKKRNINYNEVIDIPTKAEISMFKNWLKQNKNKLYWNIKENTVKLKK